MASVSCVPPVVFWRTSTWMPLFLISVGTPLVPGEPSVFGIVMVVADGPGAIVNVFVALWKPVADDVSSVKVTV